MPRRRAFAVQEQVGLHQRAALERGNRDAAGGHRGEPGQQVARRRGAHLRRVRRRDQPRPRRRNRLRSPERPLLDPVLLELGRRRGRRPALEPHALCRDASVRLRVRLPELHRSGSHVLATRVLRLQPPAPLDGEAEARPAQRLPLRPEHPDAGVRALAWASAPE